MDNIAQLPKRFIQKGISLFIVSMLCVLAAHATPVISKVDFTTTNCKAGGTITVTVTGATGSVYYGLQGPVSFGQQTTNSFTGLTSGTYTIQVWDATTGATPVTQTKVVNNNYTDPTVSSAYGTYNISSVPVCVARGIVNVTVSGGQSPYTFQLMDATGTTPIGSPQGATYTNGNYTSFTGLANATYTVRITDNCGTSFITGPQVVNSPYSDASKITSLILNSVNTNYNSNFYLKPGSCDSMYINMYPYWFNYTAKDAGGITLSPHYYDLEGRVEVPANSGKWTNWTPLYSNTNNIAFQNTGAAFDVNFQLRDPCTGATSSAIKYTYPTAAASVSWQGSGGTATMCMPGIYNLYVGMTNGIPYCAPYNIKVIDVTGGTNTTVFDSVFTSNTTGFNLPGFTTNTLAVTGHTYKAVITDGKGLVLSTANFSTPTVAKELLYCNFGVSTSSVSCDFTSSQMYFYSSNSNLKNGPYPITYTVLSGPSTGPAAAGTVVTVNSQTQTSLPSGYLAYQYPFGGAINIPYGNYKIEAAFGSPACRKDTFTITTSQQYKAVKITGQLTYSAGTNGCGYYNVKDTVNFINMSNGLVAGSYTWTLYKGDGTSTVFASSSSSTSAPWTIANLASGTYTLKIYPWSSAANVACNGKAWDSLTFTLPDYKLPLINPATSGGLVCTGQTTGSLFVDATGFGTLQYKYKVKGASDATYSTFNTSNTITGLAPGVYTVMVQDGCGGQITQDLTLVSAAAGSSINVSGATNNKVCTGSAVTLSITPIGTVTNIVWTTPTGTQSGASLTSLTIPSFAVANVGNYKATITSAQGCTVDATVTLSAGAVPTLVINTPATICGTGTTFDLGAAAVTTGSTNISSLYYYSDAAGTTALPSTVVTPVLGTNNYYIKGASADGCASAIKPVTLTVKSTATAADIVTSDAVVCNNVAAILTAKSTTATGTQVFKWYANSDLSGGVLATGDSYTTPALTSNKTYYVTVSGTNLCENTAGTAKPVNVTISSACGSTTPVGCSVTGTLLFLEDFGGNSPSDPAAKATGIPQVIGYTYAPIPSNQGQYYIEKQQASTNAGDWYTFDDHTYPNDVTRGYLMAVDASVEPAQFYTQTLTNLCAGTNLFFSAWIYNMQTRAAYIKPNLTYIIDDGAGNVLTTYYTGDIANANPGWTQYGFNFVVPNGVSNARLRIFNNAPGGKGNDLALDDIAIYACTPTIAVNGLKPGGNYCSGDNFNLSASFTDDGSLGSPLAYQWYYSAAGDMSTWPASWTAVSSAQTLTTAAVTGYYRVVVGSAANMAAGKFNCMAASAPIQVTVNAIPAAPTATANPATICVGNNSVITVTSAAATSYSIDNGTSWQSGNQFTLSPTATTAYNQLVIKNALGCVSPAADPVTVTVNSLSTTVITGGANTVCVGAITPAFIATPVGGVWSISPTSTATIISTSGVVTGIAPGTATITYTPLASSCAKAATASIVVNPIPTINAVTDQSVLGGATTANVIFSGSQATTTYNWINDNTSIGLSASGTGDINAFTAVNNGTTKQTAAITVTPTLGGCTGTATTFNIVVNNRAYVSWKTADKAVAKAGDNITYTIHVKNTGSTTLNHITVTDAVPAYTTYVSGGTYNSITKTVSFDISNANLVPNTNTEATFSFVVKVAGDLTGVGGITNVAHTTSDGGGDSPTDCANAPTGATCGGYVPVDDKAQYISWKTANTTKIKGGDQVTYTIHVKNTGSVAINNIVVTDPVPAHTTYVSGGTYNSGTNTVTFNSANTNLAPGNETSFSFVVKAAADLTGVTTVTNVATIQGDNGDNTPTDCANVPTGVACGGVIPVDTDPHYTSWKTADKTVVQANDQITYTIHFKNTGSVAINAININDPIPVHTSYVSGGTYNSEANTVTFSSTNSNLTPGNEANFSFVVKADGNLTGVTSITNVATVKGDNGGDSTTNCNNAPAGTVDCGGDIPTDGQPHYTSWKTADKTEIKANDNITYTIHFKNTGSVAINTINVSDPVPSHTTYVSGGIYNSGANTVTFSSINSNLTPGNEAVFSFVVKAAADLTGVTSITNIATVKGDNGGDSTTNCNNAPASITCGSDIPVDDKAHYVSWKTADKTEIKANDNIIYTIHFKNTGSVVINTITVSDPVPSHTTYVSGGTYNSGSNTVTFNSTNSNLIPGNEATFSFVVKAAADLTGVTSITNVAVVKGDNGGDSTTTCDNAPPGTTGCGGIIPVDTDPHYTSWKTADKTVVQANDQITYTIHFKNTGSVAINTINVSDPVPSHTTYVSGGTYNSGTNTVTFTSTNTGLVPGDETTFSFVVKADGNLTGVTSITNIATVKGDNGGDSTTNCNNAPAGTVGCGGDIPTDGQPHYTSWKIADKTEIKAGDNITYTIHFKNTGSVAINNINVTDPVPAHTTYVSGGTYNNGTNTVTFSTIGSNLVPNAETTFSFVVKAAADLTGVTSITNIAKVNGDGGGDSTTNCNNAPTSVTCGGDIPVDNKPHYTSWKTADKQVIKAGDNITYTIHFKNTGSVAINTITVSDPVPAHTTYVSGGNYNSGTNSVSFSATGVNLIPGNETSFSFVVKAAADLTGVTTITNIAKVNGDNGGDSTTNCDNAPAGTIGCGGIIPVDTDSHYASWKTADKQVIKENDQITYTIHFKNTGSVAINTITVTDPVPAHTSYVSGGSYNSGANTVTFTSTNTGLVPGNEATFSFVVKADGNLTGVTSITNVATVKGDNGGDSTTTCTNAPAGTTDCGGVMPVDDNIIGAGPVCVNATLNLRTTVIGGVWSSSNTGIAQINANTGIVTGMAAGTATISYTVNGKTVTADVTVNPLPVVLAITGNTDICITGGGTLSNTVPGGAWSSVNTSVVTIDANNGTMTSVSAGSSVIKYTVTDALTKCQTTVQTSITVYPVPVVPSITGEGQVCEQSAITLNNAVTGGVWSSSDPVIASVDNNGKVTGIGYGTAELSYTVKNNGGCSTIVKKTIQVNKKPAITTVAIAAVCAPNTIDLRTGISNYDANNYTYTFTDAAGIVVANPAAVSATGSYTVVAENKTSYCGSASQTLQVKINPKPVVNVVTFTPGEVCAPSTVNIQSLVTNYDATTYSYSYTDQYGNTVATPTAINASGNYSITATDKVNDTHCSSQPVTVVVTVNPQPVITVVNNGNMALCGNTGTVDLTTGITNYNAGYTYTFTDASGSPLSNVSAIGIPGTYYVTAKDSKCSSVKTAITLTRYATPVVTVSDPAAVYDPYTVDITAPAVTAGSTADLAYAYYNNSNVLIAPADAQQISGPGTYTYYIQGTSVQGCKSNTAPVHVLIKERPVLSISSAEIYEGQKATLTLSLPTGVTIPDPIAVDLNTRYPGSTIVKGDYNKPDRVTVPANTNSVTFVVTTWDNNVLDLDRILILEGGNTIYNVTPGTVLIHDSTSLKPQNLIITIGRDTIYGRGTGAVSVSLPIGISTSYPIQVSIDPASGTTISGGDYKMDNSVTIQPGNGSAILGVTITNAANEDRRLNLTGQSTGFVVKDGGVYIRQSRINVIPLVSDNGDGINDFLKIEGIEKYTSKMGGSNKVVLFNRWEDVIYEAGNYDNSAIKFDGRGNKHGAGRVPDGVYFYIITITIPDNELGVGESKTQTFKGYFRLQK